MLRILKTLKWKEWIYALLGVGFIVLQVWLDLTMPDYMEEITKLAVSGAASGGEIWKNGALMLGCALGSAEFDAGRIFCGADRGYGIFPFAQSGV